MSQLKNKIGTVYQISTKKGYGYCQIIHPAKSIITGDNGVVTACYEGMEITAVFPGIFYEPLEDSEILKLTNEKPIDVFLSVMPQRNLPEEMRKLKKFSIGMHNRDFPVMKMFLDVDQLTGKADFWIVLKEFSEVLYKGEKLPGEYINIPEIRSLSLGSIMRIIEKQKQPKDSVFINGRPDVQ